MTYRQRFRQRPELVFRYFQRKEYLVQQLDNEDREMMSIVSSDDDELLQTGAEVMLRFEENDADTTMYVTKVEVIPNRSISYRLRFGSMIDTDDGEDYGEDYRKLMGKGLTYLLELRAEGTDVEVTETMNPVDAPWYSRVVWTSVFFREWLKMRRDRRRIREEVETMI